jgi:MFS family permease
MLAYTVFNAIVNGLNLLETEKLGLFTTYFVGIAVTAILGSKFFSRARTKSLDLWLFMGAIATFLLTAISSDSMLADALLAFFLGASIGIGLPSCLSYFADSTSVENRGFVGGIIWSAVGFTVLVFAFLISMLGQWEAIIVLTIWRLLGGICFPVLNRKHAKPAAQKSLSYLELIRKRAILLYLFPWVMFSLINFAEAPLLEKVFGAEFFAFVQLVEFAFIGIFAIVGGIIADIAGRKRVVIAGFIMLGIEYAAMSAFSNSPAILYLFLTLDGITWGLLFSVFLTVIWGDLGENYEKEKYYTLGGVPFLLSTFLTILIKPYASVISITTAFSFASFFLFLAVIPLMYAPETLPEKSIKDRELKSYIEKAKKAKEKYA